MSYHQTRVIEKFLQRTIYLLVFFIVLFLPTQLSLRFWPEWSKVWGVRVDYLSIYFTLSELLVVLLNCFYLIQQLLKDNFRNRFILLIRLIKNNPIILVLMTLLFALILFNLTVSIVPLLSFYTIFKYLTLIVFVFVVLSLDNKIILKYVFTPLIISSVGVFVIGVFQVLMGHTIGGILYYLGERTFSVQTPGISLNYFFGKPLLRMYSTFSHPNSLAGYMLVLGSIILFFKKPDNFLNRKIKYLVLIIVIFTLGLTFSKGAILTLLILLGMYFLEKRVRIILNKSYLFLSLLISISFVSLIIFKGVNIKEFPQSESERIEQLDVVREAIIQNIFFGTGAGTNILSQVNFNDKIIRWQLQPVHNIYLLLINEYGFLGMTILYFLFGHLMERDKNRNIIYSVMAILLTGMFDHYWITLPQNRLLVALLFGLLLSNRKHKTKTGVEN